MERVIITLHGKQAEVDKDQVNMLLKKEALVNRCMALQYGENHVKRTPTREENAEISACVSKIIGLNRRIRRTVKFL